MTTTRTPNLPIRRVDGLEIPINGTWPIVRTSSVARSTRQYRNFRQIHVLGGRFEIGDVPADSSLRIDLDDSTLIATTARVGPDRHGMSEWHLDGTADGPDGHEPLALTLNYHGVFRRGIHVWAWLSGTGTIGTPAARRGLRRSSAVEQLVVDLLFNAPDVTRIPRLSTGRAERHESRVMQLSQPGSQPVVLELDSPPTRRSFL